MGGCYTPEPLSKKLQTYKANVMGNEGTYTEKAGEISNYINTAQNTIDTAKGDIASSINDAQGADCVAAMELVSQACSRLKQSIVSDIGGICSKCEEVDKVIIEIEKKQQEASNIPRSLWIEEAWDDLGHFIAGHWNNSNHGKFKKLNDEIIQSIKLAESQIDAIANASYSIELGIKATQDGSVDIGPYSGFSDNYSFSQEQWLSENPIAHLNILQQTGCAVAGAVESVVKAGEGIVDAVLTVAAGVTSLITGNDDNWFRQAAEFDFAGMVGDAAASVLTLGTVSKEQYHESAGRAVGSFVGSVVVHGALWASGLGILSAVSIAGNSMEKHLQNKETVGGALVSGLWDGTKAYVTGHVLSAVGGKILPKLSNWAQNSTNILARGYRAAATSFGSGWGANSLGTKIVSAVASPVRGTVKALGHAITGGKDILTKTIGATKVGSALVTADKAVSNAFDSALDRGIEGAKTLTGKAKTALGRSSTTGDGAIDVTGESSEPGTLERQKALEEELMKNDAAYKEAAKTDEFAERIANNDAAMNSKSGSLNSSTGEMNRPATSDGAPRAENSVFNEMSDGEFLKTQYDAAKGILDNPASTAADKAWARGVIEDVKASVATGKVTLDNTLSNPPATVTADTSTVGRTAAAADTSTVGRTTSADSLNWEDYVPSKIETAEGTLGHDMMAELPDASTPYRADASAVGRTASADSLKWEDYVPSQIETAEGTLGHDMMAELPDAPVAANTASNNTPLNWEDYVPSQIESAEGTLGYDMMAELPDAPATASASTPTTPTAPSSPSGTTPGYTPRITGAENVGLPAADSSMTWKEAESNLKWIKETFPDFDPAGWKADAATNPVMSDVADLWERSTGTVAGKIPADSQVALKQGGNWYQNAENMAKVAGYEYLGNGNKAAWGDYTDAVYDIARLNGDGFATTSGGTTPPGGGKTPPSGPAVARTDPPITEPTITTPTVTKTDDIYTFNPGPIVGAYDEHVKNTRGQTEAQEG